MFNNLLRKFYADNTVLNLGAGGDTIATDDIGGVKHELVKIEYGADGSATQVSPVNPLPVTDAAAEAALTSIAAEDFATSANQGTEIAALAAILAKLSSDPATQTTLAAILAKIIANPATDTLQTTGNTTLASILAKIIAAPATEAKQDTIITALNNIDAGSAAALGQALMAASVPVVIASNQTAIPISGTVAVTGAGDATAANQTTQITAEQAIQAAVQIMDDWDESDRAKMNIIVGQAGIAAGTGVDGVTVPRVTLATNVALPAGNNNIGDVDVASIAAGANLIGKVGIDQTTPGTTNGVVEASAAAILAKLTAAAASMVKLEDAASASADGGVPSMAIRKATPANLSDTDGDYEMLQMSAGKLWVQAGATQKPSYGATVVLAVTALQSLASSATVGWGSVKVSNVSTLATDYEIFIKLTTANTAPANDKAMYVFVCPFYTTDAGSTWFASSQGTGTLPTGTDAASTIASPHNLRLLGVLNYTTQQMVVQDTFLLSNCFGNRMPDGWSIIIINFSGAALSTACVVDYTPINDILN